MKKILAFVLVVVLCVSFAGVAMAVQSPSAPTNPPAPNPVQPPSDNGYSANSPSFTFSVGSAVDSTGKAITISSKNISASSAEGTQFLKEYKKSSRKGTLVEMLDLTPSAGAVAPYFITFNVNGYKAGDMVTAVHLKADGTVEFIVPIKANGSELTFRFDSLSPVALELYRPTASGNGSSAAGTTSPKTGEQSNALALAMFILVGAAVVAVSVKGLKKSEN